MATINGELKAGEARGALGAIGARQRGSLMLYFGVQLGCIAMGALGGWIVGRILNTDEGLAIAIGLVAGAVLSLAIGRRLVMSVFRKRMQHRNLDLQFPLEVSLASDALRYRTGHIYKQSDWAGVTELFRAKDYWIFLVQMEPWFAPRRFFASRDEERSFLREALSHMRDDARVRSADAVRDSEG